MLSRRLFSTRSLPPTVKQLLAHPTTQEDITVHGWIRSIRKQKKVAFAAITDGSSSQDFQAVFADAELAKSLTNGTSVRLNGRVQESKGAGQKYELLVQSVETLGTCDPELYPIQKQMLSAEYLRDHCHLRARTSTIASMLRLRDLTTRCLHEYFSDQGFCLTNTPILTSNDCEGAGEAFRITPVPMRSSAEPPEEFFTHPAYLTVSSQLHLEALATALSRVYTLSPCFRAERSQTNRHLAEFWMLEAEWAFTSSVHDVCDVVEDVTKAVMHGVLDLDHGISMDMQTLWSLNNYDREQRRSALAAASDTSKRWARLTYTEAIGILKSASTEGKVVFEFPVDWGRPLQSEHERYLATSVVGGPVFVTDYPASLKPFYMRLNESEPSQNPTRQTVACFDLLIPHVGELAGGSLREERVDYLDAAIKRCRMDADTYRWYVDLRKYGGAPHGGFGMGFERLISWLSGIENVRECIPIPRWAGRMPL